MYRRILVPLDGSRYAENALPFAERLAHLFEAEVHLLRVAESVAAGAGVDLKLSSEEETAQYLETLRRILESRGGRVRWDMAAGPAHEAIETYVRGTAIDLVAMATHGASGRPGHGFGSVAHKCLRVLSTPMFLVRIQEGGVPDVSLPPGKFERILIPLDGSPTAEVILKEVGEFLRRCDAEVRLLHVVPMNTILRTRFGGPAKKLTEEGKVYLDRLTATLKERGVRAGEPVLRQGEPSVEIQKAAAEWRADLVAMTTHGRSGFRALFFGGTTEKVLHSVPSPLLLVRVRE